MTEQTTISVTTEDIHDGEACSDKCCPIARATLRATGAACSVTPSSIVSLYRGGAQASLPEEARQFVRTYDRGGEVRPFSFVVDWEFRKVYAFQ